MDRKHSRKKKRLFKKLCFLNGPSKNVKSRPRRKDGNLESSKFICFEPKCLLLETVSDPISQFSMRYGSSSGKTRRFHGDHSEETNIIRSNSRIPNLLHYGGGEML